jgi:SAM-dependent methyltransferase
MPGESVAEVENLGQKFLRALRRIYTRSMVRVGVPADKIFTTYYRQNKWRGRESVSGVGSDPEHTGAIVARLPALFAEFGITSVLDIPCGDFAWMQRVPLAGIDYLGADIVAPLIQSNSQQYARKGVAFQRLDLIQDALPCADLIICRDCLVHLSFADARAALGNIIASGSRYLLSTTFTDRTVNEDIGTGGWRPINLQRPPFGFPAPRVMISEEFDVAQYQDKAIGLWAVSDLAPLLPAGLDSSGN